MHETEDTSGERDDPLGQLIRAAGRRAEPPREHRDQVHAAARRAWQSKVRARRRRRWLALAASVGLLTAGGMLITGIDSGQSGPAAVVALVRGTAQWRAPDSEIWAGIAGSGFVLPVDARLRTTGDGHAALTLADGGSLRLDSGTEIVVGADELELAEGRLYFDSAGRSPSMPMTIETSIGRVRDVGTQFEVSVTASSLRVRVREGEVAVLEASAADDIVGERGDEIELSDEGSLVRRRIAPDDPAWGWAEALASVPEVSSRSILTYFRWIARETGKRLEFESESVELAAELARFSGDPSGLTPIGLLSSIAATSDFDYRLTEDGAIVIGRR